MDDTQADIVAFLAAPEHHHGVPVEQIDTHLSHVFLAGEKVYKLKRAVRYDFADFSTLSKRKAACDHEIAVNSRLAPTLYDGVIPIYRRAGCLSWSGGGEVADWVVAMNRFDPDGQFDTLLSRDQLDPDTIKQLADKIAAYHQSAPAVYLDDADKRLEDLIVNLATSMNGHPWVICREQDIAEWEYGALAVLKMLAGMIASRGRHGWVRHCHGDLHLANICLFRGEPTPFDAIEFNDDIARIDVLYDLSFLLMDLIHRKRAGYANLLWNRYLGVTRDYASCALMPLFLSLRAAVRAMVLSLPTQSEEDRSRAGRYLDLAQAFLRKPEKAGLFALGGYSGTGKSSIARNLALEEGSPPGAIVLNTDVIRKRLAGVSPEDRLPESHYCAVANEQVYKRLFKDAGRALRAGVPVIMDATFIDATMRKQAERLAKRNGVPFYGIWLTAPYEILFGRIASRQGDASDATGQVLKRQMEAGREPDDWWMVDAGNTVQDALAGILRLQAKQGN